MTIAAQEQLKRRQQACQIAHDKMINALINYSPCRTLRIEDVQYIAQLAQTFAFDAMKEVDA